MTATADTQIDTNAAACLWDLVAAGLLIVVAHHATPVARGSR